MTIYESGQYVRNNPDYHQSDSRWKAQHILNLMDEFGYRPTTIAEVGCGAGNVLRIVSEALNTSHADGFDISPQGINLAKKHASEKINFHLGDFLTSTEKLEKYDLVMAIDVFEHVDNYIGFLQALSKTGKMFVFHIPLDMNISTILRRHFGELRRVIGHLHYFSKETALDTLEYSGFEVLSFRFTSGSRDLISAHRGWKTITGNIARTTLSNLSTDVAARILGGYSLLVLAKVKS